MERRILKETILPIESDRVESLYEKIYHYPEVVVFGPTESSKTFECLKIVHLLCATIPNFQAVVLRKAKTTIYSTILQTLKNHILPFGLIETDENLIKPYGGQNTPQWLDYKETGARMWFLGEDDKEGKALGTEWSCAMISQVEQVTKEFYEQLSGRCTGRDGNWIVNGQARGLLLSECNPAASKHFLRQRYNDGKCDMIKFRHIDSPKIYTNGAYTEYGKKTIEDLKRKYTGHLYERLYLGNWVGVAGGVYTQEYDPNVHDVEEEQILNEIQDDWIWSMSMDFGFRHPFVCGLFVGPKDKSKLYFYKEIYKTGLDPDTMNEMVQNMVSNHLPSGKKLSWTVGDHKPEAHLALKKLGFPMENADKEILPGIATVKEYLHNKKIFFNKNSLVHPPDEDQLSKSNPTRTIEEFELYAYKPEEKQTGSPQDEIPIPIHDDGCDIVRYELMKWNQAISYYRSPRGSAIIPDATPSYMR